MLLYPNAKINLGLNVVRKRSDGYHDIETLFYPVPSLCDILELTLSDKFEMQVYQAEIAGENICEKAWRLMHAHFGKPVILTTSDVQTLLGYFEENKHLGLGLQTRLEVVE